MQAKVIPEVVHKKQSAAFDILLRLYRPPIGNIRFDAMTHTKVVEGVVSALDLEGIKKYTTWLMEFVIEGDMPASNRVDEDDADMADEDEEAAEAKAKALEYRRLWAIDHLVLLVRKHSTALPVEMKDIQLSSPEYAWITRILQFMLVHGFTRVMKTTKKSTVEALRYKPDEAFSASFQQALRSRFFAALSHIVTVNTKCRSEPWTRQCFDTLLALQNDTKHVSLLTDQEAIENATSAAKLLSRIQFLVRTSYMRPSFYKANPVHASQADNRKSQYLSLFLEVLTLLSLDSTGDAEDHLEQMQDAVEAIIVEQQPATSKASSSKQTAEDSDEGEEAEPISVLIDLLVNLMQKSSVLLRTVSERVFAAASADVSEQALQLLIDVSATWMLFCCWYLTVFIVIANRTRGT